MFCSYFIRLCSIINGKNALICAFRIELGINFASSAWIRIQCKNACWGTSPNPLETSTSCLTCALKIECFWKNEFLQNWKNGQLPFLQICKNGDRPKFIFLYFFNFPFLSFLIFFKIPSDRILKKWIFAFKKYQKIEISKLLTFHHFSNSRCLWFAPAVLADIRSIFHSADTDRYLISRTEAMEDFIKFY